MDGESDAGNFGFYHFLNNHGDGDFAVVQAFLKPVEDGSGGEQRSPAFLDVGQESFFGGVEKTVQLSGPSGGGRIFGGGALPDGHELRFQLLEFFC